MIDPLLRGWILLAAGIAVCFLSGYRRRGRNDLTSGLEGWGERLLGMMLMVLGGATHFEELGITRFSGTYWFGLGLGFVGVALVWAARNRRRQVRP